MSTDKINRYFLVFAKILSFILIVSGLIGIIILFFKLNNEYSISGDKLLLDKTGQVGDYIGGVIGTIWSLAGVLLFFLALQYQRHDLHLQRVGIEEQKKEYQTNRITNILYNEINIVNSTLDHFSFEYLVPFVNVLRKHHGYKALQLFKKNILFSINKCDINNLDQLAKLNAEIVHMISHNIDPLVGLIDSIYKSNETIKTVFDVETLNSKTKNEIKSILFINIDNDLVKYFKLFSRFIKVSMEQKIELAHKIDEYILTSLVMKLNSIYDFYELDYE